MAAATVKIKQQTNNCGKSWFVFNYFVNARNLSKMDVSQIHFMHTKSVAILADRVCANALFVHKKVHQSFNCMQATCTTRKRSCLLTHILLPLCAARSWVYLVQILKFIARIELRLKTTMLSRFFFHFGVCVCQVDLAINVIRYRHRARTHSVRKLRENPWNSFHCVVDVVCVFALNCILFLFSLPLPSQ